MIIGPRLIDVVIEGLRLGVAGAPVVVAATMTSISPHVIQLEWHRNFDIVRCNELMSERCRPLGSSPWAACCAFSYYQS